MAKKARLKFGSEPGNCPVRIALSQEALASLVGDLRPC